MLIAHASQHFDEDESAFVHAVGLAAQSEGSEVVTLHVTQGDEETRPAPRPARLLARWVMPETRVSQRLHECPGHDDVPDELITACGTLRPDLVVLSTHARKGLARLLAGSIAEAILAESEGYDLVVLGATAKPAISRIGHRTVPEIIAERSDKPMVMVRSARGFRTWIRRWI